MPTLTEARSTLREPADDLRNPQTKSFIAAKDRGFWKTLGALPDPPVAWDGFAFVALVGLVAIWAALFHWTWATWGNVTVDSGREMYVPAMLAKGRMLYRDVAYPYPPLAPYLNALLYRLFGVRLEVLYWAGALSALGSAVLLFTTALRLNSRLAGWTAGAALLMEAFRRGLFSFPLPYSFPAVYGCVAACASVWLVVRAATSPRWAWECAAGMAASIALLTKLEFGAVCYAVLALLIGARWLRERTWARFAKSVTAALPGIALCAAVATWMLSIRGANFITHENFDSWPSSYFMKTYGKLWLTSSGFDLSWKAVETALLQIFLLACVLFAARWAFGRIANDERRVYLWAALFAALGVFAYRSFPLVRLFGMFFAPKDILEVFAFPPAMALIVAGVSLGAWWYYFRDESRETSAAVPLLTAFAALLPFRNLLETRPYGYSIYDDGPEVLCTLIILSALAAPPASSRRLRIFATAAICAISLGFMIVASNFSDPSSNAFVTLATDRGTIRLPQGLADNYRATIAFMKQRAAAGESVMSIPEDTSLYFFSGTECPTRVAGFVPGVVAPGEATDEVIAQIEQRAPRFLIWSNRKFPEYGAPRFGTDFDLPIGDYLRARYRPVGSLVPFDPTQWSAVVWERIPSVNAK
jgi:Dolichyl-phosphate-mannose-protein mannosyltransferase